MTRAVIAAQLAKAEEAVAHGEGQLSRQRRLIEKLERDGHDAAAARALLATFEESQALHVFDMHRLRRELEQPTPGRR